MLHVQSPLGSSIPTSIRAWLLRVHKRIVQSGALPHDVAPKLGDTHLSSAQRLPDELILEIFGYLLPVVQNNCSSSSPECSTASITQTLVRHQTYLLWACKTCRSWYAAGSEMLYMSPLLTTPRRMELFERTVAGSPTLARFVRAIYAPIRTEGTAIDLFGWVIGRRSLAVQKQELNALLENCSSPRSLTIRHSVRKGIVSRVPVTELIRSPDLSDRLEHLNLHGSTFETRSVPQFCVLPTLSDLLLPHLRILCLRGIYVLPSLHLPVLPSLHTLQLIENHYFGGGPYFEGASLPGLRTIEIVDHGAHEGHLGLRELFDETCLAHVETLRVLRDGRCMPVTRAIPCNGELRALMLGVMTARDHTDMVCWRIPDTLEDLTVVLQRDSDADTTECLDAICRCIQRNDQEKHLKNLVVVGKTGGISGKKTRADALRTLCQSRGIILRFETLGRYF